MHIEAFSAGKYQDDPDANEDQLLVLPGRGYAVIDGVTDFSGRTIDGMRTGRIASRIVQGAVAAFLSSPAAREPVFANLLGHVSAALMATYANHGLLEEVAAHPERRFGATLTLAIDRGDTFRFVLVGDSGLRLNGDERIVVEQELDVLTATLRQQAYRLVAEVGGGLDARRRVARAASLYGVAALHPEMEPWIDAARLGNLRERSLAAGRARFPKVPAAEIEHMIDHGVSGQTRFQNDATRSFGYSVFDGFPIPEALVTAFERPRASMRSIELYTDGYFEPGAVPTVASWETAADEVERVDPEKIDRYPSVKGSGPGLRTDDRTLVIVHL